MYKTAYIYIYVYNVASVIVVKNTRKTDDFIVGAGDGVREPSESDGVYNSSSSSSSSYITHINYNNDNNNILLAGRGARRLYGVNSTTSRTIRLQL